MTACPAPRPGPTIQESFNQYNQGLTQDNYKTVFEAEGLRDPGGCPDPPHSAVCHTYAYGRTPWALCVPRRASRVRGNLFWAILGASDWPYLGSNLTTVLGTDLDHFLTKMAKLNTIELYGV